MPTPAGPARVLSARYRLVRKLGSGGAGSVWSGHDEVLDRPVAVKLLHADLAHDPAVEARFRTEATAAAKLTHPSAVLVYDVGRDGDGDDYIVMELVEGTSLAAVLSDGPLPHGAAAAIGAAVASALGSAHRAGIVHRDVKPGNVLLASEGRAKLADFGIARALGDLESRLTRTGTVLGTARYLAPEQLRDDPLDGRADVYSLGIVLHEVLTGQAPFGEGGAIEVATRRLTTSLPAVNDVVPDVPPELAEIVDWATQLDPRARPADGEQLAAALRPFASLHADRTVARRVAALRAGHPPAVEEVAEAVDDAPRTGRSAPAPYDPPTSGRTDGRTGGPTAPHPPRPNTTAALPATPAPTPTPTPTSSSAPSSARDGRGSAPADAGPTPSERDTTTAMPTGGQTGPDPGPERDGRTRGVPAWVALLLLAAATVAAVVVIGPLLAGQDDPEGGGGTAAPDDGAEAPDDGDGPLPIATAGDHDPLGDGEERPEDVDRAIDGDPDTFWPSQTYTTADLGGLKEGVGIWVQLEDAADIDRVDLAFSTEGGRLELWVGDGPPSADQAPADWGQLVGEGDIGNARSRLSFADRDLTADTLLLWFTELPSTGGDFRIEVRDIAVFSD